MPQLTQAMKDDIAGIRANAKGNAVEAMDAAIAKCRHAGLCPRAVFAMLCGETPTPPTKPGCSVDA